MYKTNLPKLITFTTLDFRYNFVSSSETDNVEISYFDINVFTVHVIMSSR